MTSLTHARVDWLRRGAPVAPRLAWPRLDRARIAGPRVMAPARRRVRGEWPGVVLLAGSLALWALFVLATA